MVKRKEVYIIIVTFNGKKYLNNCLDSIKKQIFPQENKKVIIIDNGSNDGTIKLIRNQYPDAHLIENKSNLGFACANNQGIKKALENKNCKYVLTLNNDTTLEKYFLKATTDFLDKNLRAGSVTGKILKMDHPTIIDSAGDYFSKRKLRVINRGVLESIKEFNKTEECLSATAAACLFRVKALRKANINDEYFDKDFVSYIEDVDLNIRLRLLGWKVFYLPTAIVYHKGSATSKRLSVNYKEYYSRRNRLLFAIKNFPLNVSLKLLYKYLTPTTKGLKYYAGFLEVKTSDLIDYYTSYKLSFLQALLAQLRASLSFVTMLPQFLRKRKKIRQVTKIKDQQIEKWLDTFSI